MASINQHRVRRRVASVYDTAHGAQSTAKGIQEYARKMEKAVGIGKERVGNANDFLRDIGGKGI